MWNSTQLRLALEAGGAWVGGLGADPPRTIHQLCQQTNYPRDTPWAQALMHVGWDGSGGPSNFPTKKVLTFSSLSWKLACSFECIDSPGQCGKFHLLRLAGVRSMSY